MLHLDNITAVRGQGAEDGHLDVPDFDTLEPGVVFSTRTDVDVRTFLVVKRESELSLSKSWLETAAEWRGAAKFCIIVLQVQVKTQVIIFLNLNF